MQLDALRNNGPYNEGIERTFRFASPANRELTGPLERFAELLEPIIDEKFALVPVIVSQADGVAGT